MTELNRYQIEHWQFHPDRALLTNKTDEVALKPLLNKLLLHFVCKPQTLFSVSDLKQQVWQQTFLTDSAVKKAISELRQQLKAVSGSDIEYIKNHPGKGYQFEAAPILVNHSLQWLNRRAIAALTLGLLLPLLIVFVPGINEQGEEQAQTLPDDAQTLYLQGKSLYYKGGNPELVEQRFFDSIALSEDANPSHGALLDLWGLQLRSVPVAQRPAKLRTKVAQHIEQLLNNPRVQSPDNLVALAKYYLLNEGNKDKALALFHHHAGAFEAVYDPHIQAFTLALSGNKQQSQAIMVQAERRFPDRNVILWYKAYVSLLNGEIQTALEESLWAQKLAPDWYPLVFVASHLFSHQEATAWQHIANLTPAFLNKDKAAIADMKSLVLQLETIPETTPPFEVEILYLLALYFNASDTQIKAANWITSHFPEKQMVLQQLHRLYLSATD